MPDLYCKANWMPFILGMFFLFYLALGASVFSAIESPIEQQEIKDLIDRKKAFIDGHACVNGKNELKLLLAEKLFSYIK